MRRRRHRHRASALLVRLPDGAAPGSLVAVRHLRHPARGSLSHHRLATFLFILDLLIHARRDTRAGWPT